MRNPAKDLVELQENAGCTAMISVEVFLNAWLPSLDIDITHLTARRWRVEVALEDVLTSSGYRARCLVS